jgi:hypothetical protein
VTVRRKLWVVCACIWTTVFVCGAFVLRTDLRTFEESKGEQISMKQDALDWQWVTHVTLPDAAPSSHTSGGDRTPFTPLMLMKRLQRPALQLTRVEHQDPRRALVEIRGDFGEMVAFLQSVEEKPFQVTRLAVNENDGRLTLFATMENEGP